MRKKMYKDNIEYILASNKFIVMYAKASNKEKIFLFPLKSFVCVVLKIVTIWRIWVEGKIYLPYLEFVLTTKCSLKCKDCGNLMQYYQHPYDLSVENVKQDITEILNYVEHIQVFRLLGGEPFLYSNLDEVLEILIGSNKVKKIGIPSNGTVIPKQRVIDLLKNSKVNIDVSDYGVRNIEPFLEMLGKNNIKYSLSVDKEWQDRGGMYRRNRTEVELDEQMDRCNQPCRSVLNGKMFRCPRASHGDDLGYIQTPHDEYVDFRSSKIKSYDILQVYYREKHVAACDYCDMGTEACKTIPAGIQKK